MHFFLHIITVYKRTVTKSEAAVDCTPSKSLAQRQQIVWRYGHKQVSPYRFLFHLDAVFSSGDRIERPSPVALSPPNVCVKIEHFCSITCFALFSADQHGQLLLKKSNLLKPT